MSLGKCLNYLSISNLGKLDRTGVTCKIFISNKTDFFSILILYFVFIWEKIIWIYIYLSANNNKIMRPQNNKNGNKTKW